MKILPRISRLAVLAGVFLAFAGISRAIEPSAVAVSMNKDDVKGLKYLGEVTATGKSFVAIPSKLLKSATEQIKVKAAKLGATHIYIEKEPNYGPFDNPILVGFAYGPDDGTGAPAAPAAETPATAEKPSAAVSADTAVKTRTTRNRDDVKGLTRVGEVKATAKKLFGIQDKLRDKATADLLEQGQEKGAKWVLIESDVFDVSGISNVTMIGALYK